jgi:hypothetical protein
MTTSESRPRRFVDRLDAAMSSAYARGALMAVALLSLALSAVVGVQYRSVLDCQRRYAESSATSTAARAAAAAEDRAADEADRQADDADRKAFRKVVAAIAVQDQKASAVAFAELVATYADTDNARAATAKTRMETERKRALNPPPPPPSQRCG